MRPAIFSLILTLALPASALAGATSPPELVGKTLSIHHDWRKSKNHGEFAFNASGIEPTGDFTSVQKATLSDGVLTIDFQAFIFRDWRRSRLVWTMGEPKADMEIFDCTRNCRNPVDATLE